MDTYWMANDDISHILSKYHSWSAMFHTKPGKEWDYCDSGLQCIWMHIYTHLYIHMQYKYVCQRLFSSNKDQLATLSGCSCKCSEPRHHGCCVSLGCWRVHNCSMRCACLTCWQVWPLFAPAAEECGAPKMICTAGGWAMKRERGQGTELAVRFCKMLYISSCSYSPNVSWDFEDCKAHEHSELFIPALGSFEADAGVPNQDDFVLARHSLAHDGHIAILASFNLQLLKGQTPNRQYRKLCGRATFCIWIVHLNNCIVLELVHTLCAWPSLKDLSNHYISRSCALPQHILNLCINTLNVSWVKQNMSQDGGLALQGLVSVQATRGQPVNRCPARHFMESSMAMAKQVDLT